jgi:hypothetical protein
VVEEPRRKAAYNKGEWWKTGKIRLTKQEEARPDWWK